MADKIGQVFKPEHFDLLKKYVRFLYENVDTIQDDQLPLGAIVRGPAEEGMYKITRSDYVDRLMVDLKPKLELLSGYKLLPKNHYIRIHRDNNKGWPLEYHLDHCGNDLNMTINISNDDTNKDWPIYVADYDANVEEFTTDNNEGVVYDGMYPHWRNSYPGGEYIQLFMHYTREDNPNADWCRWNSNVWGHVTDVPGEVAQNTENPFADYHKTKEVYNKLKDQIDSVSDQIRDYS